MKTSETIANLSAAMASAQGDMKPAIKDATNPHFKSKYADLASVFEAVRVPFAKAGLSVWQELGNADGGVTVTTRLVHKSGEWVEFGPLFVPAFKHDAQGLGSAATYARRYGLAAALGVCADEDDDGNAAASGNGNGKAAPKPVQSASWAIKAESSEDFAAKFKTKMERAPRIEDATKLFEDNKANLQALPEDIFKGCAEVMDKRVHFLSQAPSKAAE